MKKLITSIVLAILLIFAATPAIAAKDEKGVVFRQEDTKGITGILPWPDEWELSLRSHIFLSLYKMF
ncbi:exported hypothetical protein [Candidatus Magnetomoraceae bacterium gMMP-15]